MAKALLLLALLAAPLAAQGTAADSAHQRAVRVVSDSLRAETCRGGVLSASGLTCYGVTMTARVTVLRRLANRLDSLERSQIARYDSIKSLAVLTDSTRLVVGGSAMICGVFRTRHGATGLLLFDDTQISGDTTTLRLRPATSPLSPAGSCEALAARKGLVLTAAPRAAQWRVGGGS